MSCGPAPGHGFALDVLLTAAEVADVEGWLGVGPAYGGWRYLGWLAAAEAACGLGR